MGTRHSPRPLLGGRFMYHSGESRRGIAESHLKLFGCLKIESDSPSSRPSQRVGAKRRPMTGSARAGTHNHECLCCAKLGPQFCPQQASVVMGPRFRGDDIETLRIRATRWLAMTRWLHLWHSPKQRPMIPQNDARGVVAGGAGDAAAGMRAASAMVETF